LRFNRLDTMRVCFFSILRALEKQGAKGGGDRGEREKERKKTKKKINMVKSGGEVFCIRKCNAYATRTARSATIGL
jgi:hypothetical protein